MIFLSYHSKDKGVVVPIAERLIRIYGQDNVTCDCWSRRPGYDLIKKMKKGIDKDCCVFIFLTPNSMKNPMELAKWQNALVISSQEQCLTIPVISSKEEVPMSFPSDSYIDLNCSDKEMVMLQMIQVVRDHSGEGSSNLVYTKEYVSDSEVIITLKAMCRLEEPCRFLFLTTLGRNEMKVTPVVESMLLLRHFMEDLGDNTENINGMFVEINEEVDPDYPVRFRVKNPKGDKIIVTGILHQESNREWSRLPLESK
ncbi:toll/interleukin-1 receptor domain-containing protein [Halosquirtibacter xylanolyticus]|uniref:toll/interleukin-1 receptor domain-containing protein n=1 Tax=Halosquirtibacter xylanolyticus TaxID=3374599 RepID=UPI0037485F97|nr:toll/interleukin-1 receptor domain-containing protein [Prolixibacteraceae bacterium]